MLWDTQRYSSDITVYSDASGSWRCGALWQQKWFNLPWSAQLQTCSTAVKELVPVVVAAALYVSQWRGKIVTFRVDNTAVAEVLNSTSCRDSHLMHLVRLLVFLTSYHNFWFTASHIQGKQNTLADAYELFLLPGTTGFTRTTLNSQRAGHSTGSESILDIYSLDSAVQHYYSAALAASTKKTCKAAEHGYLDFCSKFSIISLPTSEATLCYFAACLGQQGISHNTIRTYLSGIRQIQIAHGFKDPHTEHMPRLRQVLKGVKVEAGKAGKPARSRLPITPSILRKHKNSVDG